MVKIPAGVENKSRICLSREGEVGRWGGSSGNLYVNLTVEEHKFFNRDGNDILYELPINFVQAALGDEVEVPTIEGIASLKIPAGTQTNRVFRLRGKGVKNVRSSHVGDLYIKVLTETPINLTSEQKRALEKLQVMLDAGGKKHSPQSSSWKDRIKSFFDDFVS